MKTFANYCLNQSKAAQKIAAEKHYSLTTGCDAWIELQKLDSEIRNNLIPELVSRLQIACEALRSECEYHFTQLADELERMPE